MNRTAVAGAVAATLLGACAKAPAPTDAQLGEVMVQVVRDQGGVLIYHEGLGHKRVSRPTALLAVTGEDCLAITRSAYWCRVRIEYSTERDAHNSSVVELRVEYRHGNWWGKPDD